MAENRFIDPALLSRIASLEILARGVVEGFVAGLHRSPYKGFSVDFVSYRPYMPGDDLMHLDWKLYARTDRYFIKEFEDETNTAMHLLLDVSGSMQYASGAVSKQRYGSWLAASLAYLMIRQRDAAGLTFFDERVLDGLPPRSTKGHLNTLLTRLESAPVGARSVISKPLHELAEQRRRRGFVVLISDLMDQVESIIDGLRHFRYLGHEVMVFHVLDRQELQFEFEDLVEFEDLETGERLVLTAEAARDTYLQRIQAFQDRLRLECGLLGADYVVTPTDRPLDDALFHYLAARSRRAN